MLDTSRLNARERGLSLISRVNRWMIAGAVGLTGLVSLVAARSFHGRTLSSTSAVSQSSSSSSSSGGGSSSASGGIQQPAQPPSSVPAPVVPAPVVSGGS